MTVSKADFLNRCSGGSTIILHKDSDLRRSVNEFRERKKVEKHCSKNDNRNDIIKGIGFATNENLN